MLMWLRINLMLLCVQCEHLSVVLSSNPILEIEKRWAKETADARLKVHSHHGSCRSRWRNKATGLQWFFLSLLDLFFFFFLWNLISKNRNCLFPMTVRLLPLTVFYFVSDIFCVFFKIFCYTKERKKIIKKKYGKGFKKIRRHFHITWRVIEKKRMKTKREKNTFLEKRK